MLRVHRRIQTVAAVASVATAILAFLIQQEIAAQERHRASVSRAVALYRDFVASDAVIYLRDVAHEIDNILWIKWRNLSGPELSIKATEVFKEDRIVRKLIKIKESLSILLQSTEVIYKCGNFGEIYEPDSAIVFEEELCDRRTISVLLGSIVSEMHSTFRSVMYCDDFIKDRYFGSEFLSSHVGRFESMVEDHIRRDFESRRKKGNHNIWHVFRTEKDRKEAIDRMEIDARNRNYSVIRFDTEKRCELYR